MAAPSKADMKRVTLIARRIQVAPKVVITTGVASMGEEVISAYVDSLWAGIRRSWRSTRGGVFTIGGMAVKT